MVDLMINIISPKIRRILLHWGYDIVKDNLLRFLFLFIHNGTIIFLIDKNY